MPIETIGLSWASAASGFLGSLVSLKFLDGQSTWQRLSTVGGGTVVAAYCSPLAVSVLGLTVSSRTEGAVAFLIGLFGMSLAGAITKAIPEWAEAARQKWVGK